MTGNLVKRIRLWHAVTMAWLAFVCGTTEEVLRGCEENGDPIPAGVHDKLRALPDCTEDMLNARIDRLRKQAAAYRAAAEKAESYANQLETLL